MTASELASFAIVAEWQKPACRKVSWYVRRVWTESIDVE
jgi:hypothetical protein